MKLYYDFQGDELCSDEELMLERPAFYLFTSSLVDLCRDNLDLYQLVL